MSDKIVGELREIKHRVFIEGYNVDKILEILKEILVPNNNITRILIECGFIEWVTIE